MVSPDLTDVEFSPLDQIRHTEAQVTRRIAAARVTAEQIIAQKHLQATQLKNEAREIGSREGQTRYIEIVSKAEDDAKALVAQAHNYAENLRQEGIRRVATAVGRAVNIIIGIDRDEDQ